ncbi:MAG: diaminopimelate epimerase [Planctomycetota bacterium]|nr:diaminopimelate epimerase [Planctomycetota bacterium]
MKFTKMHGAGNDYIYVDCFQETTPAEPAELAKQISDRRFGVGADGLILILPTEKADAQMRMFNADGSEAEMCGNGIRCVAKYVYDHGICKQEKLSILTGNGVLDLSLEIDGGKAKLVTVDMGKPILSPPEVPTTISTEPVINHPTQFGDQKLSVTCVSMGNPHCVVFVPEATDELVLGMGPQIETDSRFPQRVNVEFIEQISEVELRQRTWERGSGETWACGTGASAVCVAGVLCEKTKREVLIHLLGGDLHLRWDEATEHVYMTGGAVEVFQGEW